VLPKAEPEFDKWGLRTSEIYKLIDQINNDGCNFEGLSFYLAKTLYNINRFMDMLNFIQVKYKDYQITTVNVGGGVDDPTDVNLIDFLSKFKRINNIKRIIVEPGRCLLDPSIDMLVSITGIRSKKKFHWIYLDAGIYNGLLDFRLIRKYETKDKRFKPKITLLDSIESDFVSDKYQYFVSGPTSDMLDVFGSCKFPKEINEGDKLLINNCGAYSFVLKTNFGGTFPLSFKMLE
jgi:diaminopimelate decarboxylase